MATSASISDMVSHAWRKGVGSYEKTLENFSVYHTYQGETGCHCIQTNSQNANDTIFFIAFLNTPNVISPP